MNSLLQTSKEQKPLACIFIAQDPSIHYQYNLSEASWLPLIKQKFATISIDTPSIDTIKNTIAEIGRKISLVIIIGHGNADAFQLNTTTQSKFSIRSPSIETIFPADRIDSLILLSCKTGRSLAPLISKTCSPLSVTAPLDILSTLYTVSYPCELHQTCHFKFYSKENNNDITYTSKSCTTKPDFRFFKQSIENYLQQEHIFTASQIAHLLFLGFAPEKQEIFKADPEKAVFIATRAAQQDLADAQTFLGVLYLNQNKYTEAEFWLLKAAKKDWEEAQTHLGKLYLQYNKQNEAEFWLLEASKKDYKDAQANLGQLYLQQGEDKKAMIWLLKGAKKGHTDAQTHLGYLYLKQSDYAQAEYWLSLAAKQGSTNAQAYLGGLYLKQRRGEDAKPCLLSAAQKGHKQAQTRLGYLYLKQNNYTEAERWLLAGALQDLTDAQAYLGALYLKQNRDEEAEPWLLSAAQKGCQDGHTNLQKLYLKQRHGKHIIAASIIENAATDNKSGCARKSPLAAPESPQAKKSKQVSDS